MATATAKTGVEAEEVRIVGRGTLAGSGLPFVLVSSSSEPGRAHVVAYAYEGAYVGSRIHCDCTAATYGRRCKHVRRAEEWLEAERMVAQTTSAPKRPRAPSPPDVRRPTSRATNGDATTAVDGMLRREPFHFMR